MAWLSHDEEELLIGRRVWIALADDEVGAGGTHPSKRWTKRCDAEVEVDRRYWYSASSRPRSRPVAPPSSEYFFPFQIAPGWPMRHP